MLTIAHSLSLGAFIPDLNILDNMTICPSFSTFKFNADPNLLDMSFFQPDQLEASTSGTRKEPEQEDIAQPNHQEIPDFENAGAPVDFFDDAASAFGHDGGYPDDDGANGFEPAYGGDGASGDEMAMEEAGAAHRAHYGAVQRFDPRMAPDDREVVIGLGGEDGDKQVFSYFDTNMSKNWAGPEHWKMRRTIRRFEKEKEEEEAATAAADKKARSRRSKEPFSINFNRSEDNQPPNSKTIFATSKAALEMPTTSTSKRKRGTLANKKEDYLLPDDKHFSSQQLLTLFLKPKAAVNMKRRLQRIAPRPGDEVDEHYWAAAAAAQTGNQVDMGKHCMFERYCLLSSEVTFSALTDEDDEDYGPILPFDTQFFHDDGDTPDFDEDLPMGGDEFEGMVGAAVADGDGALAGKVNGDEEEDLLKATQTQVKRARPVFVNYARKAKRVDVRKLKENIWKELALENPTADVEEDADSQQVS